MVLFLGRRDVSAGETVIETVFVKKQKSFSCFGRAPEALPRATRLDRGRDGLRAETTTASERSREARGAWGATRSPAPATSASGGCAARRARGAGGDPARDFSRAAARRPSRSPLVDGSSDSVFKKPRARHISSVELRASLATLDAPAAATPFAASAPLSRACFGTSWDVRRELRGGGARALPRVSAIQPTQRKKGARLAHQLS